MSVASIKKTEMARLLGVDPLRFSVNDIELLYLREILGTPTYLGLPGSWNYITNTVFGERSYKEWMANLLGINALALSVARVEELFYASTAFIDLPIKMLFLNGEQGVHYDPSDLSTLFQDAAGTIPVTADGDPVGRMEDKSGNGNHATQSVAASRPTYRTDGVLHALEFDGVDDAMSSSVIDLTATDKISIFLAINDISTSGEKVILETGPNFNTTPGTIFVSHGFGGSGFVYGLGDNKVVARVPEALGRNDRYITAALIDKALATKEIYDTRVNGALLAPTYAVNVNSTGTFASQPINIGGRSGGLLSFHGNIYGIVLRGNLSNEGEVTSTTSLLANKSGVTL